ncbi:unnamed protein product [Didymodactylos carnosus]|uniref:N-acetyltransferase domain-containing protein n=1 Tax=Didymodactylos carnosus TaxID=1234261 RepID=A0A8S2I0J3_9BILA|nr:unnamed protein product [Didymodactylos carnosus]CAF3704859.1 unnamed protein product [Didymodactylos carnosus]
MISSETIKIRQYQSTDLEQCENLFRQTREEVKTVPVIIQLAFDTDMSNIEKNYLLSSRSNWWVAVSNHNQIIGQIALQPLSVADNKFYQEQLSLGKQPHPDDIGELRRLSVHKEYRCSGLGRRLLQILVDYAKEECQYKYIHLTTGKHLKSDHFYEQNGFKCVKFQRFNLNKPDDIIELSTEAISEYDQSLMYLMPSETGFWYKLHYLLKL